MNKIKYAYDSGEVFLTAENFFEDVRADLQERVRSHLERNVPLPGLGVSAVLLDGDDVHTIKLSACCVHELLEHWEIKK